MYGNADIDVNAKIHSIIADEDPIQLAVFEEKELQQVKKLNPKIGCLKNTDAN